MSVQQRAKNFVEKYTLNEVLEDVNLKSEMSSIFMLLGDKLNFHCSSCIRAGYQRLQNKKYIHSKINTMAKKETKGIRYGIPENRSVRLFGTGVVINHQNIASHQNNIEQAIKKNPGLKKQFIDYSEGGTQDNGKDPEKVNLSELSEREKEIFDELESKKVPDLKNDYEQMTGNPADSSLNKDGLKAALARETAALEELGDLDEGNQGDE